jgi:exosortase A
MDAPEVTAVRGVDEVRWGPLSWVSAGIGVVLLLYFGTFSSMVSIWSRSDTFAHGYFVVPISLYLIWTLRHELDKISPRADRRALLPLAAVSMGWLAARLAGVLVVEQYFAVAAIPLMVWAVLGPEIFRKILFPLGYLLLAVPVGEALIPYLIDYTAWFTVAALRFTGVPVYQEGNFLTLPNSRWSVVEACSGLRYLIACVTIGLLYAYLTYRSWKRRAAFMGLALVVPIVANWIRAYLIVFLGYASDMRLAVGIDHLIYGWVFYGLVMLLLFWVGSLFRDAPGTPPEPASPEPVRAAAPFRPYLVALAAVLCAAVGPLWAALGHSGAAASESISFAFPETLGSQTLLGSVVDWEPHYVGAGFSGSGRYRRPDGGWVGVHVAIYRQQDQESELVSSSNALIGPKEDVFRQLARSSRSVGLGESSLGVEEALLDAHGRQLLVWKWFWVSGRFTSSEVWAKILEAREKLLLGEAPSAGIVVFTEVDPDEDAARARLTEFLQAGLSGIEAGLEESSR